jgi:hypothetical protein
VKIFLLLLLSTFLLSCVSTNPYDDIEYDLYKPLIEKLLADNQGEILTPKDVKNIDLNTLPKNYQFTLVLFENGSTAVDNDKSIQKFEGVKNDEFLFSSTNTSDKSRVEVSRYSIINNRTFYNSTEIGLSRCYFMVGTCNYRSGKEAKLFTANTVYENGLWITSYKTPSGKNSKRVAIYDKFGLPIYRYTSTLYSHGPFSFVFARE